MRAHPNGEITPDKTQLNRAALGKAELEFRDAGTKLKSHIQHNSSRCNANLTRTGDIGRSGKWEIHRAGSDVIPARCN
jgi:hypothetical protein